MANFPFDLNQPPASDDSDSPPHNDNSEVSNLGDQKTEEDEHFSIRGYVAGVRERHPEQCNPFSSMNHGRSSMDATTYELAPMQNPEFNDLQSENITTLRLGSYSVIVSNETQKTTRNAEIEYTFTIVAEELLKMVEAQNNIGSIEYSRNCSPSTIESVVVDYDGKGKKKAHFEDDEQPSIIATEFEYRILLRGSSSRTIMQGTADDEGAIVVRAKGVKRVGDAASESFHRHLHERIQNPGGIVIGSPRQRVIQEEAAVVLADDIRTEGAGNSEGLGGSHSNSVQKVSLPDLNEVLVESEGHDKNEADENMDLVENDTDKNKALVENDDNDKNESSTEDDDDYFGKDCRKTPKTRLISEILGIKPNETKLTKANRKNISSLKFGSERSNPRTQLSANQRGNKQKRASFYRDNKEAKTMENKSSNNNGTKKQRTFRAVRICESESSESETESDSEYEAFARKRCRSSVGKKKPVKKRNYKRAKSVQGDGPSSMAHKKMKPKSSSYKKGKSSDRRKINNNDAAHVVNDRIAALMAKKKGKMVQTGKGSPSDSPKSVKSHVSRECSSTGKEKDEDMQKCTEDNVVRDQSSSDGFDGNRKRRTVSKTDSKGKRMWIPEGEEGGS